MDVLRLDATVRVAGVPLLGLLAAMLGRGDRGRRLATALAPLANGGASWTA